MLAQALEHGTCSCSRTVGIAELRSAMALPGKRANHAAQRPGLAPPDSRGITLGHQARPHRLQLFYRSAPGLRALASPNAFLSVMVSAGWSYLQLSFDDRAVIARDP